MRGRQRDIIKSDAGSACSTEGGKEDRGRRTGGSVSKSDKLRW